MPIRIPYRFTSKSSRKSGSHRKNDRKDDPSLSLIDKWSSPPHFQSSDSANDNLANWKHYDYEDRSTSSFFDPSWNFETATFMTSEEYDRRRLLSPPPPGQSSREYEIDRYKQCMQLSHRERFPPTPQCQPYHDFEGDTYARQPKDERRIRTSPIAPSRTFNEKSEMWLGDDSRLCSSPLPLQHSSELENDNHAKRHFSPPPPPHQSSPDSGKEKYDSIQENRRDHSPPSKAPSYDFGIETFENWLDDWDRANHFSPPSQPSRDVKDVKAETSKRRPKQHDRNRPQIMVLADDELDALEEYVMYARQFRKALTRLKDANTHKGEQPVTARVDEKPPTYALVAPKPQPQERVVSKTSPCRRHADTVGAQSETPAHLPRLGPAFDLLGTPPNVPPEGLTRKLYSTLAGCNHKKDRSLTLSLWAPSHVAVGSVGYYSKCTGTFVTLFNALSAFRLPSGLLIPSAHLYGKFHLVKIPTNSATDQFSLALTPRVKQAYAFAKSTAFIRIDDLDGPREWFDEHAETIVREYKPEHNIRKEDICFVTGTLNAEDYALFVSNTHPEALLSFDVERTRVVGQPWGRFVTRFFEMPEEGGTPSRMDFIAKMSTVRTEDEKNVNPLNGDTLMLARLGFRSGDKSVVM